MTSIKILSRRSADVLWKLPLLIGNGLALFAVVICLTVCSVWAEDAPNPEKKEDDTVKQEEVQPQVDQSGESETNSGKTDAGNNSSPPQTTQEIIVGSSDNAERDEPKGIIIFTGNVKMLRYEQKEDGGKGEEIGFLNGDKVTLKNDLETGRTKEVIAEGNVEIRDKDIFATCNHAILDNLTNLITLTGDVVVLQEKDRLETKVFTFNRVTGKQTGEGGVKFEVRITQVVPETPAETDESEKTEPSTGTSDTKPGTAEEKPAPAKTKEDTGKADDSGKADSEEKTAPSETKEADTDSKSDTDKETPPTETEEKSDDTEEKPDETEEKPDDTEPPEETE